MHCLAGLDELTSGAVYIGDTYLAKLNDKQLTELRRTAVGFIFQAYNLIPTLTAEENITLPLLLGGNKGDQEWIDRVIDTVGLRDPAQAPPERAERRPAAARRRRPGAGQPADDHLRRRADRQPRQPRRRGDPRLHAPRRRELGQTIVMVTHDPIAASYADRVDLPRRRQDRRRDDRADRRAGARPDEALRGVTMFRLSLKNVLARKGRLALTALAIIAGTAFLVRRVRVQRHDPRHVRHDLRQRVRQDRRVRPLDEQGRRRVQHDARPDPRLADRHGAGRARRAVGRRATCRASPR